jgi:hypothetical protein
MAYFRIDAPAFSLNSKYECGTEVEYRYEDSTHDLDKCQVYKRGYLGNIEPPAKHVATFDLSGLPEDVTITGATVYATLGIPKYGAEASTINGVSVGYDGEKYVPVTITDGATSVSVDFAYQCIATAHTHFFDGTPQAGHYWDGNTEVYIFETTHESVLAYSDVYLLVEYKPAYTPPELLPYTDPAIIAGETYVKAVHMTELHTNTNRVREAHGLPVYNFPAITAMESLLAYWNADVIEIRVALDAVGIVHEPWLPLDFNRPRLDVLLQLRRVVAALATGDGDQVEITGVRFMTADGELLMTADGRYFRALEETPNG